MNGLTAKQAEFVRQYMVDFNGGQAAIRAGYSKRGAAQQASNLLTILKVQQALTLAVRERAKKTEIKAEHVLQRLADVAFANMSDYATWGPRGVVLREMAELGPKQLAAIQEVSQTVTNVGGSKRIKLHDKLKALELLGRHLGLWDRRPARRRVFQPSPWRIGRRLPLFQNPAH